MKPRKRPVFATYNGYLMYFSQNKFMDRNHKVPFVYKRKMTPDVLKLIETTHYTAKYKTVQCLNDIEFRMLTRWCMGWDNVLTPAPGDKNYIAHYGRIEEL